MPRALHLVQGDRPSTGKAKNFRAHGDKFLCAQKNIFVRTEISLPAEEKNGAFGRRKISFRKEENFRICENIFSYIWK